MRALQFINTLNATDGGPARNSFELNLALNRLEGTDVNLHWLRGNFAESVAAGSTSELPVPGPRKVRWRSRSDHRTIGIGILLRSIQTADIVVVHGYFLPWIPPLAVLCRLFRTPFVITPHGSLTRHQRGESISKKRVYEMLLGRRVRAWSSGFITGSKVEAEELVEAFPQSSAEVGGVGTDLSVSTRHVPGPDGEIRLLSMSRVAPKKRVDLMIDAVAALRSRGHLVRLTVAGAGDDALLTALKAQASALKVSECISFVGPLRGWEKEDAFARADVFLLPSDDENFGIGLAEALAHGVPSVVSDRVAASGAMSPEAGRVLANPTGSSIAEAVEMIALRPDIDSSRRAARRAAEENFDWILVAGAWRDLLAAKIPLRRRLASSKRS